MRIALALRVSSDMQVEYGWSLDDQEKRGKAWATNEGHSIIRIYRQEGVSAGVADRDELLEIVNDASNNVWDGLWIWNVTRFTRHPDDIKHLRSIEFDNGKRIFEDGRPITTLTPSGELDVSLRVIVGSYELAKIRQETSRGKRARALGGKSNSSIAPTGYQKQGGELIPRPDNSEAVKLIFTLFKTEIYTIRQVTEIVQSRGYRTNAGKPFSVDTVTAILRNKFYAGFVAYRGLTPVYTQAQRPRNSKKAIQWFKGMHAPLIDEETWERCQQIRIERSGKRYGRAVKPNRIYLINHLARCAGCGGLLRAHSSVYEKPKYRCSAHDRGMPCASERSYIRESVLEAQIDEHMAGLVWTDEIKRRALEMSTHADQAKTVLAERKRIQAQLERAKMLFEMGDYTPEQYQQRKVELSGRIAGLQVPEQTDVQAAMDLLNDAASLWRGADRAEKRDILHELFDAIIIDLDAEKVIEYRPKTQFAALFRAAKVDDK